VWQNAQDSAELADVDMQAGEPPACGL